MSYASNETRINIELKKIKNSEERYQKIVLDLQNYAAVKDAIETIKPDLVIHLAAESHVDRSISSPKEFVYSNIIGTFNILEAVRIYLEKENEIKKSNFFFIILVQTSFWFLIRKGQFNEETAYNPNSPYSASKAASDHLVKSWGETFGIDMH